MTRTTSNPVTTFIRRLTAEGLLGGLPDDELLRRFSAGQDEAAFRALLARHGPMVLGVCRAVLGNEADAEDAFQVSFLALARLSAGSGTESVGGWLHGVAYRTALKSRAGRERRSRHEAAAERVPAGEPDDPDWGEVRRVVHEELDRLPDLYRAALVACFLQGKTQAEAAAELGLPKGTLKGRLERGRAMLRRRLVRRGLGPWTILVLAAWPANAGAVTAVLARSTIEAVTRGVAAGQAAGVSLPAALPTGVLRAMYSSKLKAAATAVIVAGAVIAGLAGMGFPALTAEPPAAPGGGIPQPAPAGPGGARVEEKTKATELEGVWVLDSRLVNGVKPDSEFLLYEWTFKGDKAALRWARAPFGGGPGAEGKGELKLVVDAGQKPNEITLNGNGNKLLGIYKLDKDTLTLAFFGKAETARPKGFTPADAGTEGSLLVVWTLKRKAK